MRITFDIEIYTNYFLAAFYVPENGKSYHFELHDDCQLDRKSIVQIVKQNTIVTFNGNNFDMPILFAAIGGAPVKTLKAIADRIIRDNIPGYKVWREFGIEQPFPVDHIDLIEIPIGQSSLKTYGARLNAHTIQDLPIEPSALITPEQRPLMRAYCENDLKTTWLLHQTLVKQIALREAMGKEYGVDLRSKSDAQIAEAVIVSELKKITGKTAKRPDVKDNFSFYYRDPNIIAFKSEHLKTVFKTALNTRFELNVNGQVKLPEALSAQIPIGRGLYTMGIGGLHSCEKAQYVTATENDLIIDLDVASFYPSIILQQKLAPNALGAPFLKVYQSLVTRRLNAKKNGDKVAADTIKIVVNGSYGKLGSKYSALFAPELMIQTTITGQLALLMLIEAMENEGFRVISANTDGIVIVCDKSRESELGDVAFAWMLRTSYELERNDYKAIASRDVNNYVAVKTNGEIKRKGVFAAGGLAKNPDFNIISEAVAQLIANNIPIENTVKNCRDILAFCSVRKVTGGATWRGAVLGKTVRFYMSNDFEGAAQIEYAKNSNKVPKSEGSKPLMTIPDKFPTDVDHQRYINSAKELAKSVGVLNA